MTQTPSPDPTPQSESSVISEPAHLPTRRSPWRKINISIGVAIALLAGICYWRLRVYVYTQLVPQIEGTLLEMIERPVEMGAVERFSPIGIRFGPTTLPATPTDADEAITDAIQVRFNPLSLLIRQELNLRITLVNASASLDQNASGQWLTTQIASLEPGLFKVNLRQINLKNTTVSLQTFAPSFASRTAPITLKAINGHVQLRNKNQRFLINIGGKPTAGGSFHINGDVQLSTSSLLDIPLLFQGRIETERLPLATLAPLGTDYVPTQFGQITHGFLNSGVTIKIPNPADPRALAPDLELWGNAEIWNLSIKMPGLNNPIHKVNGQFIFKGERVNLKGGEARYGTIRAKASGRIHLQDGYSINASIPAAPIARILAATQLELPINVKGAFESQLRLTGPLTEPLVTGLIKNKNKIWVDNLRLNTVKARIRATAQTLDINTIEATPQVGGSIIGSGQFLFQPRPTLELQLIARELPGDKIIEKTLTRPSKTRNRSDQNKLNSANFSSSQDSSHQPSFYNEPAPQSSWPYHNPITNEPITVGKIAANVNISGALDQLQAIAQFQAPKATFPTQGNLTIVDRIVFLDDVDIQAFNGSIDLKGRIDLEQQQWQAIAQLNQLSLSQPSISPAVNITSIDTDTENDELERGKTASDEPDEEIETDETDEVKPPTPSSNRPSDEPVLDKPVPDRPTLTDVPSVIQEPTDIQPAPSSPSSKKSPTNTQPTVGILDHQPYVATQEGTKPEPTELSELQQPISPNPTGLNPTEQEDVEQEDVEQKTINQRNFEQNASELDSNEPILTILPPVVSRPLIERVLQQLPFEQLPQNPFISTSGVDIWDVGTINGRVSASGSLTQFHPEALAVAAQLQLSDTPLLNQPLSTIFRWTGSELQIDQFETPLFSARGALKLAFIYWTPSLRSFDVYAQVEPFDLADLDLSMASSFNIKGKTTFDGRIFGTLEQPVLDGFLQFEELAINNQIQFPMLEGPVQFSQSKGILVDLRGDRERISATLGSTFLPTEFALHYDNTLIAGSLDPSRDGHQLITKIQALQLSAFNLNPASRFQLGPVSGQLSSIPSSSGEPMIIDLSNWDWHHPNPLDTLAVRGSVAITQPSLGYLTADCFQAQVALANGIADIIDGQLILNRHQPSSTSLLDTSSSHPCPSTVVASNSPNDNFSNLQPTNPQPINELTSIDSQYTFNGRLVAAAVPSFDGTIAVENGNLQDWLQLFQFFDFQDIARGLKPAQFSSASDITPFPVPFPTSSAAIPSNTRLMRQLQRYAEIIAFREYQRRQQQREFSLPQPQDLSGTFSGTIDVAATPATGFTAAFNLMGTNWQWGPYHQPSQMIAQGEFANGTINFQPLRFETEDSFLNFSGAVGWGDDATGQFRASNISVAWLKDTLKIPLPTSISGNVDITANIVGNLQNPGANGAITLRDATLKGTPIQSAGATFTYGDARLGIIGKMKLQGEPTIDSPSNSDLISLQGFLPYRFPQATVEPSSDAIDLKLALRDDGIALLNLLNEQLFWEEGNGTVILDIGGTLRQTEQGLEVRPTVTGTAQVEAATFSAQFLPAPLTNVSGDIIFDGDRITANTIQGQFSEGNFVASGIIPLLEPFTPEEIAYFESPNPPLSSSDSSPPISDLSSLITNRQSSPSSSPSPTAADSTVIVPIPPNRRLLSLELNDLALNLKGIYRGGVDGRIDIRGTALKPEIGGGIILSNGRISLIDPTILPPPPAVEENSSDVWGGLIALPELTDLKVTLGRRLLITRLPILNFLATGELIVNGPLQANMSNVIPKGVIELKSGQVNLFTTQFNLDRSHENTATFTERTGSDPILDVHLETSVLEENRRLMPDDTTLSRPEITETSASNLSQLQTIRIEARVKGPASQLFDNIELASSPSRSETEIITLIGGGFVDTLGRSEGFVGIANLAGTALFTSLQTLLSNAIGFSDFRIFPTVITDVEREEGGGDIQPTSTLAVAAELGIKITNELSISALQLLTVEEPTQYNIRYQINDELLLRGSSNFSDDSRIILEFETRF